MNWYLVWIVGFLLLLFAVSLRSSKTVKTADDYAMLRLDKNNYKLIVAEWEIETGLRVDAQGEDK